MVTLVKSVVVLGVGVVLPLAVRGRVWWWVCAAATTLVAFLVQVGWSGLLVVPFVVAAAATVVATVRELGPPFFWRLGDAARALACVYALVAAAALAQSRFGVELFGIREPFVQLTAVHYIYAGTGALVLAAATLGAATGRWRRVARAGVALTAAAPPVVAAGFVTGWAVPQVGGAILMTLGVWLTATLELRAVVAGGETGAGRALIAVSGLAVWAPMVLAVAWAAGQHWNVPVLSIDDMARTHGLANALAFVLCGLIARHLSSPVDRTADESRRALTTPQAVSA